MIADHQQAGVFVRCPQGCWDPRPAKWDETIVMAAGWLQRRDRRVRKGPERGPRPAQLMDRSGLRGWTGGAAACPRSGSASAQGAPGPVWGIYQQSP